MTITAIDTNILLDILLPNQPFIKRSLTQLKRASEDGSLAICEIVYAELASQFHTISEINRFLIDTHIKIDIAAPDTLFEAGQLWNLFKSKRRKKYFCASCGKEIQMYCLQCNESITAPRRMLNDFIIGAHAKKQANRFLTRDRGFYRHYFKDLEII
jgi:predicted nucleic acid-binding protein